MSRRQFPILRFLFTYFCVMLPILCTSFMLSHETLSRLKEEKEVALQKRIAIASVEIDQIFQHCKENAVKMGLISQLQPNFMLRDEGGKIEGLSILQALNNYDSDVDEVFMHYSDQKIYFSSGRYTMQYFSDKINCDDDSVQSAQKTLESRTNEAVLLWSKRGDGYLLLHFPCITAKNMSVNYLISFSNLIKELQSLQDNMPMTLELTLSNQEKLFLSTDGENGLAVSTQQEVSFEDPVIIENALGASQWSIRVSYSGKEVFADVLYNQSVNYILIIVGIFLATLIAYGFGRQRKERISRLEEVIQRGAQKEKGYNFGDLEGIHQLIKETTEDRAEKIWEYNSLLKQKTAAMIFNGILKDKAEIEQSLYQCNVSLCEEYYFVGAVWYEDRATIRDCLENIFIGDLVCRTTCRKGEVLVFLLELPVLDRGKNYRMKLLERLINAMQMDSTEKICISVSQVYRHLQMVNIAYMEAVSAMEAMPDNNHVAYRIQFWENLPRNKEVLVVFNFDELNCFSEALEERDLRRAKECLHDLCCRIEQGNVSYENRRFLRQCVIQAMIADINEYSKEQGSTLVQELIRVNPSEECGFEDKLMHILHRHLSDGREEGSFERILKYIQEHYTDFELTAEQVANEAGYTKFYLAKLFKANTGYSYIDYLTNLRMERACELLRTTDLTISAIAEQVGYADDSGFRRKFKKLYGISVTAYRKENS